MAVVMRLSRKGTKKNPFYKIVVINSRNKREGKFIDEIGSYNPIKNPSIIEINKEKAIAWLNKGAKPSAVVKKLLRVSKI